MKYRTDNSKGDLNGFLDAGSHIKGELFFEDTFRIDGRLTGSATSRGDLVVGESGEVEAEIRVGRIFVSGKVSGAIHASERIEITSGGCVTADIETPSLVVEDGALFEGRCSMSKRGEGRKPGEPGRVTPITARKES